MKPFPLPPYYLFLIFALCLLPSALSQTAISQTSKTMEASFGPRGITSITCPQDPAHANLLGGTLGNPVVRYKIGPGDWLDLYRDETRMGEGRRQKAEGINQEKGLSIKEEGNERLCMRTISRGCR
jgi:hypothetical protein